MNDNFHVGLSTGPVVLGTNAGAVYTLPANTVAIMQAYTVHNASQTVRQYPRLYWVPNGGSSVNAGSAGCNEIFGPAEGMAPGEVVTLPYAIQITTAGDTIQGITGTANTVTVTLHGWTAS
jgi:hypothetical protein